MAIHYKNSEEIMAMREAGRIVARCHEALREAVKPGISTWELDQVALKVMESHGAVSAFIGYPYGSQNPFPAHITTCINDELVHGIPNPQRILTEGDIVSLDVGVIYKGFVGDAAFSMGVGKISKEAQRLLDITEAALYEGIRNATVGNYTSDVSKSIQHYVEKRGCSVVREYTGHGVGRKMHEEPQVPNWWPMRKIRGWKAAALKPGMTFALEPMVNAGRPETRVLDDEWTVVTEDGSLCAHFEHTIAITEGEPLILTVL
ncbi:MAG: type I methionyl aminopeptidase [Anaerolineales bacterium]|nr:type I methionyl aminopeptidase [Anaerolineales bacterium]